MDKFYEFMTDPQQMKPAGWCPGCGSEIWADGEDLCRRCKREEGEHA